MLQVFSTPLRALQLERGQATAAERFRTETYLKMVQCGSCPGSSFGASSEYVFSASIDLITRQGLAGGVRFDGWHHFGTFDDLRFDSVGDSLASPLSTEVARRLKGSYRLPHHFANLMIKVSAQSKGAAAWLGSRVLL
jgi:hypothetical protein